MELLNDASVSAIEIRGLHGTKDVRIDLDGAVSIFMGPNGIGKSTILNIFVHALSRQWARLAKQSFDSVTIFFRDQKSVSIDREDCASYASAELSPRLQSLSNILATEDALDFLIDDKTAEEYEKFEEKTGVSRRDINILRNNILHSSTLAPFIKLAEAANIIKVGFEYRLVYLPTYRRIEQELSEIFSSSSSALRRLQAELSESIPSPTAHYVELVKFGMEDIDTLIKSFTGQIKEFSRQQINLLSTRYLTAALRPRQRFEREFFNALTDKRIKDVLARVDDQELNPSQRTALTELIKSLRVRGVGRLTRSQEHIAGYFHMLAETHDRISQRESELQRLATLLNKYIGPSKQAHYDQTNYQFYIRSASGDIPLGGLSSGEKQVIALFATIALSENKKLFVVVDEPELSLSVLWQEILVEDIMSLSNCKHLLAVTHSPFIYGERLAKRTRDLSDLTRSSLSRKR